jgi:thiamine transporter
VNVRLNAEIAMAVALAIVLELLSKTLPLPRLPYGGSVSLRMLPILVVAFRSGWKPGCVTGILYGLVDFSISPFYFHPIQFLLDYPLAFGAVGLAGLLKGVGRIGIVAGVLLGNSIRFAIHVVSGTIFFAHLAPPGQPVLLYSIMYNISYMLPETIIDILLSQFLLKRLIFGKLEAADYSSHK